MTRTINWNWNNKSRRCLESQVCPAPCKGPRWVVVGLFYRSGNFLNLKKKVSGLREGDRWRRILFVVAVRLLEVFSFFCVLATRNLISRPKRPTTNRTFSRFSLGGSSSRIFLERWCQLRQMRGTFQLK